MSAILIEASPLGFNDARGAAGSEQRDFLHSALHDVRQGGAIVYGQGVKSRGVHPSTSMNGLV